MKHMHTVTRPSTFSAGALISLIPAWLLLAPAALLWWTRRRRG